MRAVLSLKHGSLVQRVVLLLVPLCALGGAGRASDWPQFRGPGGRGVCLDAAPLPARLDETTLVWTSPVGPGISSPCVVGERIFLTSHGERELITLCLDRASGAERWRRALEVDRLERTHEINGAASATAASDGRHVFVTFGSRGLLAYTLEGELAWERRFPEPDNTFGSAASPIVVDGRVFLLHDSNAQSFVEALAADDGKVLWHVDRDGFGSGWSTPVVHDRGDDAELLVYGVWWLTAYDLLDGTERWSLPGLSDEPIVMPATGAGLVFLTSYNMKTNPEVIGLPQFATLLDELDRDGDGVLDAEEASANASVLSRHDADGEGDHPLRIFFGFLDANRDGELDEGEWLKLADWLDGFEHANATLAIRPGAAERQAAVAWQHARGVPECPSPLLVDGRLYTVKNGGIVTCLDAASGTVLFEGRTGARGPHYASPVAGDGKLYAASARGDVAVLGAGKSLNVLALNDLGERIMATPALADGRVYVRTRRSLRAYAVQTRD